LDSFFEQWEVANATRGTYFAHLSLRSISLEKMNWKKEISELVCVFTNLI